MPSSGLSPLVRFVPFFPFSRSFLPPFSVITSHALSASFVVAIFLFRPFLIAPLRFAFFKVEKRNRPLFFQRWLFLQSVRGSGTPTADFLIFPLLRSWRRSTLVASLRPRSSSYVRAPRLPYVYRPPASPNFLVPRHWLAVDFTPFTRNPTKKSTVSAPLRRYFFGGVFFLLSK
jgi:hypothetical protein